MLFCLMTLFVIPAPTTAGPLFDSEARWHVGNMCHNKCSFGEHRTARGTV
jgi:hypothetical protein